LSPLDARRLSALVAGALGAVSLFLACSPGSDDGARPETADGAVSWPYIAETIDFAGFCKWSSAPASPSADASDGVHVGAGPLTIYWNRSPPHGSTQFPVGTIIVKESNEADALDRTVFAMVKRQPHGTGYNADGADGWEWMSLQDLGNCNVQRLWRGPSPPVGESYAMTGACNPCHMQAASNDYVWDDALQLSKF
jgi:hypothetical protein